MRGAKVVVACSGGRDSLALASVLARIAPRAHFEVSAFVYVDHGPDGDPRVVGYRKQAAQCVREFANARGVEFTLLGPSKDMLSSEAALRRFRHESLKLLAAEQGVTAIAFAHHADDLLETRLIRLMRGTGATGLEAMTERKGLAWRPFLKETRDTISTYVTDQAIEWIEDPTNADTKSLRNWIRAELFPKLDSKRAGATRAIARSLELIVQELRHAQGGGLDLPRESAILVRSEFEAKPVLERKRALALYASRRGARDLTSRQVEEVLKRLSSFESQRRRTGTFSVAGLEWAVSSKEIVATPVANGHETGVH
ncbi:MAG: tRNA lysidine(34) synthetase TilS [Bdellovibrionota bacterium]